MKSWVWRSVQCLRMMPLVLSRSSSTRAQLHAWPRSSGVVWLILIPVLPGWLSLPTASLVAICFHRLNEFRLAYILRYLFFSGRFFERYWWLRRSCIGCVDLLKLFVKLTQCVFNVRLDFGCWWRKRWTDEGVAGESHLLRHTPPHI